MCKTFKLYIFLIDTNDIAPKISDATTSIIPINLVDF